MSAIPSHHTGDFKYDFGPVAVGFLFGRMVDSEEVEADEGSSGSDSEASA